MLHKKPHAQTCWPGLGSPFFLPNHPATAPQPRGAAPRNESQLAPIGETVGEMPQHGLCDLAEIHQTKRGGT